MIFCVHEPQYAAQDPSLGYNMEGAEFYLRHTVRLFECIGDQRGDMRKGSPRDYTAEIDCSQQPIQKSRIGEPHECYSLYRIRRTQENHCLLCKGLRRPDCGRRHTASAARGVAALGEAAPSSLARSDGSHPLQCLDLRHLEAVRPAIVDGPSGQDEGHHGGQEEERLSRCTYHCRPAAVQSVACVLRAAAAFARSAASAALSKPGRAAIGPYAEQDGLPADGKRRPVRQRAAASEEVLRRPDEEPAGSTGIGQRSATFESRFYGDVRVYAETADQKTALRSRPGAAPRAIDEHRRSRSHHGADMGIGSRRSTPLLLCSGCSQLLWLNGGVSILCGQTATGSNFQAAQRLAADGPDRSRQTGAALESAIGSTACSATGARPRQSCDLTSGAQVGGLPAGSGQERPALSGSHSASAAKSKAEEEQKDRSPGVGRFREKGQLVRDCWSFLRHADLSPDGHSQLVDIKGNPPKRIPLVTHRSDESGRVSLAGCSPAEPASVSPTYSAYQSSYVQSVSDPPAGPRVFRGCARGLRLPIHLTVCFEAGRFTLTQSSWTASARRCSRKWMSGHAAKALVLISDRGQPKAKTLCSLGEPTPPGQRESPFPLDHYLSWMSTKLSETFTKLCPR